MYVTRARIAATAIIVYILVTFAVFLAGSEIPWAAQYDAQQYSVYLGSYISFSLITLMFKKSWDFSNKLLQDRTDELSTSNNSLKQYTDKLESVQQELEAKVAELERTNDVMIGREKKMMELKERLASLEQTDED